MLSTTILRVFLVFAALLFLSDKAAACSCIGLRQLNGFHPCMAYRSADAVFTGQVTAVNSEDGYTKVVRFAVDEAYRGVEGRTIEVRTSSGTASCGYDFHYGLRYFVYARRDWDGTLTEGLCGPTVLLDAAARDLEYAREIMRGEKGARIVGVVVKYDRGLINDIRTPLPLPGVDVFLERVGQPAERWSKTVTNTEGRYEFRGLAPGKYRIRADLPIGPREWSAAGKPKDHSVELRAGTHCELESFILTTSTSIRGRLITPGSSPLPQQYLALIPLDENGNEISSSLSPSVSSLPESGHYYFHDVVPG